MGIFIGVALIIGILRLLPLLGRWWKINYRHRAEDRNADIFDGYYLDSKAFYLYRFRLIPCTTYIGSIEASKAFRYIREKFGKSILDVYQACYFNRQEGKQQFSKTLLVLDNKMIIELADNYARIWFPNNQYTAADTLIRALNEYRLPEKKELFEINIITFSDNSLDLKRMEIKPTVLDLGMYYNDDFVEVDRVIRERLSRQNDKGIVLLHGLPGTGKTTYLRHLIGGLKKKVLFVSPSVAGNLMNPGFIELLIENPDSVLIIEDAENILVDRRHNTDSPVSSLLNLGDGLLSDCINVQVICTFNCSIHLIDPAMLRKGRLIARYEFGKLSAGKAQALSRHLGFDTLITQEMTLAEIAGQHERQFGAKKAERIGFRQEEPVMS